MYHQPKLDFGESAEVEAAAEKRLRAERAAAFERAAVSIGIRPGELGYRLAGALGVYVDSPSMRRAGLTGLRWQGTTAELAADPRLAANPDSVARALRRFVRAGFVSTEVVTDDRGRKSGVCVCLNMRAIHAAAASCRDHRRPVEPPPQPPARVSGAQPGAVSGADAGADPGAVSGASTPHYIPVLPKPTVNPLPRVSRANSGGAGVVSNQDWPTQDWATIAERLRAVGLERVRVAIDAALEAGLDPAAVGTLLDEYAANVARLRSPGAILERIRSGCWPVPIRTAADVAAAAQARAAQSQTLAFERARSEAIRRARARGEELDDATADALAAAAIARQHQNPVCTG